MNTLCRLVLSAVAAATLAGSAGATDSSGVEALAPGLSLIRGPVNGVRLEVAGKSLAIYGDPREKPPGADRVLLTHARRDVAWAARPLVEGGAVAVVPEAEAGALLQPQDFWRRFDQARFHNYSQPSTKVPAEPLPAAQTVRPGEVLTWEGIPIRVLATPGYTPGAVSYLVSLAGKTIAFTGDLIYGDGKVLDLYSFQEAIPEAKEDGYHGYAGRLGELVASLRRLAAEKPGRLIPARGPVIEHPSEAIGLLLERVQALYANYLSIDALRWYRGDQRILAKARRVLGPEATVDWMPMAETHVLPGWVRAIDNTRLILAADGSGFLVDCGSTHILEQLKQLRQTGTLASLDQLWVTHYHDDHTDQVSAEVAEFGSTVLACRELWDVLERPGDYSLPCLTRNPIAVSGRLTSGARWRWKEFDMTGWYFPGQTLYHQALLVRKDGGESILFVGDSFTPSGIDDYCLQNRNFLHPGTGYFQCLSRLRALPAGCWLVNQHVEPMFRFSPEQLQRMQSTLEKRVELLRPLFPWDDPNYGLDEGWARLQPYGIRADSHQPFACRAILLNHSPREESFEIRPRLPKGWACKSLCPGRVQVPPGQEGAVEFTVLPAPDAPPGLYVITADVKSRQLDLREWMEALVRIGK
ncbi:MAG TPA: MBL fold metallo-hydrolase [Dongiaceae bacterium]|nr:MBL fold metallo-hydrolase [Dongiaceae bacterium]